MTSLTSLPDEILVRIVNEVVNDDLAMAIDSWENRDRFPNGRMTSEALMNCSTFFATEVRKEHSKRCDDIESDSRLSLERYWFRMLWSDLFL